MYETYTALATESLLRMVASYQRDFHIAVNPHMYQDDPSVLPTGSKAVVLTRGDGVVALNYSSDDMRSLMAKTIPRIESILDEAFRRAQGEDFDPVDRQRLENLDMDVTQYLDMLMGGTARNLIGIEVKADTMCHRLNL